MEDAYWKPLTRPEALAIMREHLPDSDQERIEAWIDDVYFTQGVCLYQLLTAAIAHEPPNLGCRGNI
jgi:hypothetical protein